ncbi:MAG: nucleotidyl transferase AbiEii/AbiGii toxin family protein, partial [Kiritimatiellae bacterium]|nr:nucleotidyl transferase AbiEii/AbiGii toxin family protein [Kiritimatiellia bacterium]
MKQPVSRHLLDIAIDRLADKYGDPIRIRRMMANTIICQMLPEGVCVKGGSALKFRFGDAATRFTRDLDIARSVDLAICVKEIDSALRKGWNGFTGVL